MHLSILVPYRDRALHLARFVPHMTTYLDHFKKGGLISEYSVHVVEQQADTPFNRGKLLNCGFQIAREQADFVCLHDVDYLPVLADYTAVDRPTRLIWHGLTLKEDHQTFFGAVVQFPTDQFIQTNGYSNGYWGWGFEDVDLRYRCQLVGLTIGHRDGTFQALPHPHNGNQSGASTPAALRNRNRCIEQIRSLQQNYQKDGLSNLEFERLEDVALAPGFWLHRVNIGAPPSPAPQG